MIKLVMTPALRQLALDHAYETEQADELDRVVELLQEQETPDGYELTSDNADDALLIGVVARALL